MLCTLSEYFSAMDKASSPEGPESVKLSFIIPFDIEVQIVKNLLAVVSNFFKIHPKVFLSFDMYLVVPLLDFFVMDVILEKLQHLVLTRQFIHHAASYLFALVHNLGVDHTRTQSFKKVLKTQLGVELNIKELESLSQVTLLSVIRSRARSRNFIF